MDSSNTVLNPILANRIPLGALALILAGLTLAPTGLLMRGVPTAPERNLEFAAGANSSGWRLGMALAGISLALLILGTLALYAHLSQTTEEGLAFAGLVMTIGLIALMLPATGFAAYVVPAVGRLVAQGQAEMVEVMNQTFKEPFLLIPFFSGILWNVGSALRDTVAVGRTSVYCLWRAWHTGILGCEGNADRCALDWRDSAGRSRSLALAAGYRRRVRGANGFLYLYSTVSSESIPLTAEPGH
jgi:hypothetical protein